MLQIQSLEIERGISFLLCESLIGFSDERNILEDIAIKSKTEKYENMPNFAEQIVQVAISHFDDDNLNAFQDAIRLITNQIEKGLTIAYSMPEDIFYNIVGEDCIDAQHSNRQNNQNICIDSM